MTLHTTRRGALALAAGGLAVAARPTILRAQTQSSAAGRAPSAGALHECPNPPPRGRRRARHGRQRRADRVPRLADLRPRPGGGRGPRRHAAALPRAPGVPARRQRAADRDLRADGAGGHGLGRLRPGGGAARGPPAPRGRRARRGGHRGAHPHPPRPCGWAARRRGRLGLPERRGGRRGGRARAVARRARLRRHGGGRGLPARLRRRGRGCARPWASDCAPWGRARRSPPA